MFLQDSKPCFGHTGGIWRKKPKSFMVVSNLDLSDCKWLSQSETIVRTLQHHRVTLRVASGFHGPSQPEVWSGPLCDKKPTNAKIAFSNTPVLWLFQFVFCSCFRECSVYISLVVEWFFTQSQAWNFNSVRRNGKTSHRSSGTDSEQTLLLLWILAAGFSEALHSYLHFFLILEFSISLFLRSPILTPGRRKSRWRCKWGRTRW